MCIEYKTQHGITPTNISVLTMIPHLIATIHSEKLIMYNKFDHRTAHSHWMSVTQTFDALLCWLSSLINLTKYTQNQAVKQQQQIHTKTSFQP